MACRDCKWWDYVTADVGWCEWAVKNMPRWVVSQLERTEVLMISEGGEGCPQFKEPTDGE
jgi:hypothetical protein